MKGLIEQIYPLVKNLGSDEVEALLMRLAKNIESLQAENERLKKAVEHNLDCVHIRDVRIERLQKVVDLAWAVRNGRKSYEPLHKAMDELDK